MKVRGDTKPSNTVPAAMEMQMHFYSALLLARFFILMHLFQKPRAEAAELPKIPRNKSDLT